MTVTVGKVLGNTVQLRHWCRKKYLCNKIFIFFFFTDTCAAIFFLPPDIFLFYFSNSLTAQTGTEKSDEFPIRFNLCTPFHKAREV